MALLGCNPSWEELLEAIEKGTEMQMEEFIIERDATGTIPFLYARKKWPTSMRIDLNAILLGHRTKSDAAADGC
jgi:hypothetical protein